MLEIFDEIERRIRKAGYLGEINGRQFYFDISDEAENKEEGTYMFIIKKSDIISYEGCMDIMDKQFDLHYVDICVGDLRYHVDFDK